MSLGVPILPGSAVPLISTYASPSSIQMPAGHRLIQAPHSAARVFQNSPVAVAVPTAYGQKPPGYVAKSVVSMPRASAHYITPVTSVSVPVPAVKVASLPQGISSLGSINVHASTRSTSIKLPVATSHSVHAQSAHALPTAYSAQSAHALPTAYSAHSAHALPTAYSVASPPPAAPMTNISTMSFPAPVHRELHPVLPSPIPCPSPVPCQVQSQPRFDFRQHAMGSYTLPSASSIYSPAPASYAPAPMCSNAYGSSTSTAANFAEQSIAYTPLSPPTAHLHGAMGTLSPPPSSTPMITPMMNITEHPQLTTTYGTPASIPLS